MNNMKISPQIIKGVTSDIDRSLDEIKINIKKNELEIKQVIILQLIFIIINNHLIIHC